MHGQQNINNPENHLAQRSYLVQTMFLVNLKINSIIYLNGVNCLVFVWEEQLVYCVVLNEFS